MISIVKAFVLLFTIKIRFPKSKLISDILCKRYGPYRLSLFRSFENYSRKEAKCKADRNFLYCCKASHVFKNFSVLNCTGHQSKIVQYTRVCRRGYSTINNLKGEHGNPI